MHPIKIEDLEINTTGMFESLHNMVKEQGIESILNHIAEKYIEQEEMEENNKLTKTESLEISNI